MENTFSKEGTVDSILFRSDSGDFCVFLLRYSDDKKSMRIRVSAKKMLQKGQLVSVSGDLTDWQGKPQVKASVVRIHGLPNTAAMIRRVCETEVAGIGEKRARALVDAFGEQTLQVIENEPSRVAQLHGFSDELARRLSDHHRSLSNRAAGGFLAGLGLNKVARAEVRSVFGGDAELQIKANPYTALACIEGMDFRLVDEIAGRLGIHGDDVRRLEAGVIESAITLCYKDGHSCIDRTSVAGRAKVLLKEPALSSTSLDEAIDRCCTRGFLSAPPGSFSTVGPSELINAEKAIAARCIAERKVERPSFDASGLDAEALHALDTINTSSVCYTDTGIVQSYTYFRDYLSALLGALVKAGATVNVVSPMYETAAHFSESDLYRCMWLAPKRKSEYAIPPCSVTVCLDAEQLDIPTAHDLFARIGDAGSLILVGSRGQLGPMGPGCVFEDIAASGVVPSIPFDVKGACSHRSEIYNLAEKIRLSGEVVASDYPAAARAPSVIIHSASDQNAYLQGIPLSLKRLQTPEFGDKNDIQVITAIGKGPLGSHALNASIQRMHSKPGAQSLQAGQYDGTCSVFIGDRIILTRGIKALGLNKGMTGVVTDLSADQGNIEIDFAGKRVTVGRSDLSAVQLGYAITARRAQGSSWEKVILVASRPNWQASFPEFLLTALSVAEKHLIVIAGSLNANEDDYNRRITSLKFFLQRRSRREPENVVL